jgi:pimeloyl-ACP methyl ester carboxylesterase
MLEYEYIKNGKETIVLSHDGIGCVSLWKNFPDKLSKETGYSVLVYSRYGHGNSSPATEEFSFDNEVEVLHDLINKLNINKPIIFGHSCGSVIAMHYAVKYPVKKLLLTAGYLKYDQSMVDSLNKLRERLEAGGMPELSNAHKDVDSMFYPWYKRCTTSSFEDESIFNVAKQITCPVTLVKYNKDPYSSPLQTRLMEEAIPQLDLILITGNKHTVHKRNPELLIELLK